jgi:hypothetical protein
MPTDSSSNVANSRPQCGDTLLLTSAMEESISQTARSLLYDKEQEAAK